MAYIIAVNPNILTDTGGTCSPADCTVCHSTAVQPLNQP